MNKAWLLALLVACGGGGGVAGGRPAPVSAPVTSVPENAPIQVPGSIRMNLQCKPIVVDNQTPSEIPLNIDATQIKPCSKSPSTQVLSFYVVGVAPAQDSAYLALANFHGADTYKLGAAHPEKISFDGEHGGTTVRGQSVHSTTAGRTCTPSCNVVVTELPARANGMKTFTFKATCDQLCVADQYICKNGSKPIEFEITNDCRNT